MVEPNRANPVWLKPHSVRTLRTAFIVSIALNWLGSTHWGLPRALADSPRQVKGRSDAGVSRSRARSAAQGSVHREPARSGGAGTRIFRIDERFLRRKR